MNFIINLLNLYNYNAILIIIYKLLKERYYVSYFTNDKDITVKKTAKMLI